MLIKYIPYKLFTEMIDKIIKNDSETLFLLKVGLAKISNFTIIAFLFHTKKLLHVLLNLSFKISINADFDELMTLMTK
jgi:hypothetical protein